MAVALRLAQYAAKNGEVPVGAVVVRDQQIIGWGANAPIANADASAHAEILAIRRAGAQIGNYRLIDCALYVTLEPCCMCFGAVLQARLRRLIFGAQDAKTGAVGSVLALHQEPRLNHHTQVVGGLMAEDSASLLRAFFAVRR